MRPHEPGSAGDQKCMATLTLNRESSSLVHITQVKEGWGRQEQQSLSLESASDHLRPKTNKRKSWCLELLGTKADIGTGSGRHRTTGNWEQELGGTGAKPHLSVPHPALTLWDEGYGTHQHKPYPMHCFPMFLFVCVCCADLHAHV